MNLFTRITQKVSLRVILIASFAAQIIIIAALVGYISFRNGKKSVNTIAQQLRGEVAARIEQHLYAFLDTPRQINQFNVSMMRQGSILPNNVAGMQSHFLEQVKVYETVSSVYFGNADGGIVGSGREGAGGNFYVYNTADLQPGVFEKYIVNSNSTVGNLDISVPNFDARTRPWYISAVTHKSPIWSDIYVLFTGQDMAIAASSPVYDENSNLIGVCSVDIFLSQISDFLRKQYVSKSGKIFIIDRAGLMVATSSNDILLVDQNNDGKNERLDARDVATPIIHNAAEFLFKKYKGYENIPGKQDFEFYISNEHQFAQVLSLRDEYGVDWLIVVVVPESDFTSQIVADNQIAGLIIFFAVIISFFLSVGLARRISAPISQFIEATKALSNQEWGGAVADRSRIMELNDLALSFNQMGVKLRAALDNLSSEILKREQVQRSLLESESRYATLMENIPVGVFRSSPSGRVFAANPAYLKMFGKDTHGSLGEFNAIDLYVNKSDRENLLTALHSHGHVANMEIQYKRDDESHFWAAVTARAIRDEDGNVLYFDGTIEDITERKIADDAIKFMATHDVLTEIPNRVLFEDRLLHAMDLARRTGDMLAIVFLDLDGFKSVNDAFGHKHGDWLLQLTVSRLKSCVRASDTVARFGGDEFAIILEQLETADDAIPILEKIGRSVSEPFKVMEAEVFVTASIGVSIFPSDGADLDTLIQNADRSMYRAKEIGKNNYQFFSTEMKTQVLERLALGNQLRHAIDQRELSIYYQPQVDTITGRVIGLEALLRWEHPTLGLLTPGKFIALAQDSGLIVPLGEWVLENVCTQINNWREMGLPMRVAVNISAREVKQKNLIQVLHRILANLQTPPELLELEVTEGIVFQDVENMLPILRQIKNLGARLAIDDFGTGYSSLGRLAQFPFDTLKIDKHFAPRENSIPSELIVVKGIVSIAKNLGLDVIAEGVETKDQLAFYKSLHCTHIQGWYFSKAIPVEEAEKYLRDGFPPDT